MGRSTDYSLQVLPLLYANVFRQSLDLVAWWQRLPLPHLSADLTKTTQQFVDAKNCATKMSGSGEQAVMPSDQSALVVAMGSQLRRVRVRQLPALSSAEKRALTLQKMTQASPLLTFCRWLPWVRGVAVTGSLSVFDPKKPTDDVDFMIVCAPNRLWLTRPLLVWFSQLFGRRRTWKKEEPNSWCFNLWLEESALKVRSADRNYYLAHEVCQAWWLISKNDVGARFLAVNSWASVWLPRLFQISLFRTRGVQSDLDVVCMPWPFSTILDWGNHWAYTLQRHYMRPHQTTEKVSKRKAAFHR